MRKMHGLLRAAVAAWVAFSSLIALGPPAVMAASSGGPPAKGVPVAPKHAPTRASSAKARGRPDVYRLVGPVRQVKDLRNLAKIRPTAPTFAARLNPHGPDGCQSGAADAVTHGGHAGRHQAPPPQ